MKNSILLMKIGLSDLDGCKLNVTKCNILSKLFCYNEEFMMCGIVSFVFILTAINIVLAILLGFFIIISIILIFISPRHLLEKIMKNLK